MTVMSAFDQIFPQDVTTFRERTQKTALFDLGCRRPSIDNLFHPHRNGPRLHPTTFANQVHDDPTTLAELNVFERERGQLFSTQSTANQKSEDAIVALARDGCSIRYGD